MNPQDQIAIPNAPAPDYQEEELDLGHYVSTLAESKGLIFLVTALVFLMGVVFLLRTPYQYTVDALIQVEEKKSSVESSLTSAIAPLTGGDTTASAQLEILGSRLVMGKAVENLRLNLGANPDYFPVIGSTIARFQDRSKLAEPWFGLKQYAWGGEVIKVQSFDVPPGDYGKVFTLEAGEDGRYRLLGSEDSWSFADPPLVLEGKVGEKAQTTLDGQPLTLFVTELKARPGTHFKLVRSDLLSAVNALKRSIVIKQQGSTTRKDTGVISLSMTSTNPDRAAVILNEIANIYLRQNVERKSAEAAQTLAFLERQLPSLKKDLEVSESALNTFRLQQGSLDLPKEVEQVLQRIVAIEGQLLELKQKREELIQKFTPAHPAIVALDAQSARLNKELDDLNRQVKKLPNTEQQMVALMRDVQVNTNLYTALLNRAQELQVAKAGTLGNVRIIDYAIPSITPVSPKKTQVLTLALVLGLFLGIVVAFVRKALRKGVEDPDQLEKQLGLPVYATIPHSKPQERLGRRLRTQGHHNGVLAVRNPEDAAIESLRSLRTTLHFIQMDAKNNIMMITGPSPGVGKSFVSVNLGAVHASAGKRILLIDADLRKGMLHRYVGVDREPGLTELISATMTLEEVVRPTSIEGLDLITTGKLPPNPSELLLHERFANYLEKLSQDYNQIIIDCAPVLAVTDAAIVGRLAGTTLLVLKAGVHPLREIEQSMKRLKQAGVNLRGMLFNDVQFASKRYYSYGKYVYQYAYNKK
ncbi:MAG: polysaccharide biosynthesis tyrosine autokinase [Candidatus Competibacteraceae bacterium]